jgi:hypothetical protein
MTHPAYSYLTPDMLELALDMARRLHGASMDVSMLANGGYGSGGSFSGGGRLTDRSVAVREWVGPHRDTFDLLFDNEMASADTTWQRLADEADEWARFWAMATNARNQRLYDEAMQAFNTRMDAYQDLVQERQDALDEDPDAEVGTLPSPPIAPGRPAMVSVPVRPTYAATG